jgi:hypothetical protein
MEPAEAAQINFLGTPDPEALEVNLASGAENPAFHTN